jgi:hypothetical protein
MNSFWGQHSGLWGGGGGYCFLPRCRQVLSPPNLIHHHKNDDEDPQAGRREKETTTKESIITYNLLNTLARTASFLNLQVRKLKLTETLHYPKGLPLPLRAQKHSEVLLSSLPSEPPFRTTKGCPTHPLSLSLEKTAGFLLGRKGHAQKSWSHPTDFFKGLFWESVSVGDGTCLAWPSGPLIPPPPTSLTPHTQCQSGLAGAHSWNCRGGQEEGQGGLFRPRHAGTPGTRELGLPWRSPGRQGGNRG